MAKAKSVEELKERRRERFANALRNNRIKVRRVRMDGAPSGSMKASFLRYCEEEVANEQAAANDVISAPFLTSD